MVLFYPRKSAAIGKTFTIKLPYKISYRIRVPFLLILRYLWGKLFLEQN